MVEGREFATPRTGGDGLRGKVQTHGIPPPEFTPDGKALSSMLKNPERYECHLGGSQAGPATPTARSRTDDERDYETGISKHPVM